MIFQQLTVACLIFLAPVHAFHIMSTSTTSTQLAATGKIADSVLDLIGNTPLVKLNKVSTGCEAEIVAKLESSNPANSVKDRIALSMINEAEKRGEITPGKSILVGTLQLHLDFSQWFLCHERVFKHLAVARFHSFWYHCCTFVSYFAHNFYSS
jgi:hypothetical protein